MTLDDDLRSAGRRELESAVVTSTAADLRVRRRRGTLLGSGAAAAVALVAAVATFGGGVPSVDRSIDVVGEPEAEVEERLRSGVGNSVVTDADGTVLAELGPWSPDKAVDGDPVVARVWEELLDDPATAGRLEALGVSGDRDERARLLATAGLRVETSIDPELQAAAEARVAADPVVAAGGVDAAVVTVEQATGRIRALRGAVVSHRRQIGSLIKPVDMIVARRAGVAPDERIDASAEVTITSPQVAPDGWTVSNFAGIDLGDIPLAEAVAKDANTPWVVLYDEGRLTPAAVLEQSRRMGMSAEGALDVPSVLLGAVGATPLEVGAVYATIAAEGLHRDLRIVDEIVGSSGRIHRAEPVPDGTRAVEPELVAEVRAAMAQVMCCGTGQRAQVGDGTAEIGKTGTTPDAIDAWFAGSTPRLTTVVWMGGEMTTAVGRRAVTGGGAPAELWRDLMQGTVGDGDGG